MEDRKTREISWEDICNNLPPSVANPLREMNIYQRHKMLKNDIKTVEDLSWAINNLTEMMGCLDYAHWFQPLTGEISFKEDSLFRLSKNERFFGASALTQGEPDASSFPNGGMRSTFEARGYTYWDASAPLVVLGTTLLIPTVFTTLNNQALDYKKPLLRTRTYLNKQLTALCNTMQMNVSHVNGYVGIEQEFFVVKRELYAKRLDLNTTGRTLFGALPAKNQQFSDHYFVGMQEKIRNFLKDFKKEALSLGIPIQTRHNEVAPCQFEIAPEHEEINIANDHNQLTMLLLQKIAHEHDLQVIFHEKPFDGINGSGKHCNWSLQTDTGLNLFTPGKTEQENLLFLCTVICLLKAIHTHHQLIRGSIATPGNELRLGGHEAPPAIVSVYLGELGMLLDEFAQTGVLPLTQIKQTADRNRTSPFAYVGNRFEFRAVGASQNIAGPMTVLMTALGREVAILLTQIEGKSHTEIITHLQNLYTESKDIIFAGDGYSDAWKQEAVKRGFVNTEHTLDALQAYKSPQTVELFSQTGVLSEVELVAFTSIREDEYHKIISVESDVLRRIWYQNIASCLSTQNKTKQKIQTLINELSSIIPIDLYPIPATKTKKKKADIKRNAREVMHDIAQHLNHLEVTDTSSEWGFPSLTTILDKNF